MAFTANVDAVLRQNLEKDYEDAVFKRCVALGLFTKGNSEEMGGNAIKVTVKSGYSPGVGGTYATAFANVGETLRDTFLVTPATLYALEQVDNVGSIYSMGDNAIINTMSDAQKSCMNSASMQVEQALFGDGYGTLFTIASNSAGVLTATDPTDVFRIQRNQVLVSKATPASASLDTGTATVTAVNPIAGTVTVTANGGWTATNGHVVGLNGTMLASATISTFPGLKAWLTDDSTALAASFYGNTNRANDPVTLAGHVIDCTGLDVVQAVNRVMQSISNFGNANSDLIFMNTTNAEKMYTLLDTRARYTQSKGESIEILYDGFSFVGPAGNRVTVHPASACGAHDIFVLDSSTWYTPSPKNRFVMPGQPDGTPFVNLISADATLVKMRASGFVYTNAPGFNGRAKV